MSAEYLKPTWVRFRWVNGCPSRRTQGRRASRSRGVLSHDSSEPLSKPGRSDDHGRLLCSVWRLRISQVRTFGRGEGGARGAAEEGEGLRVRREAAVRCRAAAPFEVGSRPPSVLFPAAEDSHYVNKTDVWSGRRGHGMNGERSRRGEACSADRPTWSVRVRDACPWGGDRESEEQKQQR